MMGFVSFIRRDRELACSLSASEKAAVYEPGGELSGETDLANTLFLDLQPAEL